MNEKGFRRVVQVGIVVRDIRRSREAWGKALGLGLPEVVETDGVDLTGMRYKGQRSEGRAKLAFFQLENITIELIEPIGGPSIWQDFLEQKGEGIHHVAFRVETMQSAREGLQKAEAAIVQEGDFQGGCYAYSDPKSPLGAIIELLEY